MQSPEFLSASSRLTVDLTALADNWRAMNERSGKARAAAVLKADAYGLGVVHAAPALYAAGARDFFVASVEEGADLRPLVPDGRIYILAGMWPGNEELFFENDLVPIINSEEQLAVFMAALSERGDHPCVLHVDTGMNRLGLSPEEAVALAHDPARPASFSPVLVMSHLACADDPGHPMNRYQLQRFREVTAAFEGVPASLANSGGVFLGADYHFDLTRPGIAVYGGEAVNGAVNPMKAVVTAEARIVQVRTVPSGETASSAPRSASAATAALRRSRSAMPTATTVRFRRRRHPQTGDALGRLRFPAWYEGAACRSGDYGSELFDVTDLPEAAVRAGDYIEVFGRNVAIDDVARAGGTIGYELLTSLGRRYHRTYVGGA